MAKRVKKTYRLIGDKSGQTVLIKVGRGRDLILFDEKEGVNRSIRHCPNERSIFIEEQSKHAKVTPVKFKFGLLEVEANKPITQDFLDNHPSNAKNGGTWFKEIIESVEAEESIELEEIIINIKQSILEKSKTEEGVLALTAVVSAIVGSAIEPSTMSTPALKSRLYQEANINPYFFINEANEVDVFENVEIFHKYMTLVGLKDEVIRKSKDGRTMVWGDTGKTIVTCPSGVDLTSYFTNYLDSDEGRLVLDAMGNKG